MFVPGNLYYGNSLSNSDLDAPLVCDKVTAKSVTFIDKWSDKMRFTLKANVHPRLGYHATHGPSGLSVFSEYEPRK